MPSRLNRPKKQTKGPNEATGEEWTAEQIVALSRDGILVADLREKDTPLVWVNSAFEQITEYASAEAVGKNCRYLQGSDRLQPEIAAMRGAIERREPLTVTVRNYTKSGRPFWNELTLRPLRGADGTISHCVGLMRDVTMARDTMDRLLANADRDELTGLPNRYAFLRTIEASWNGSGRNLIIIKIDLADVNGINSSYGDEAGDEIIRQTATRLGKLKADSVGRIGNNEFAIAFVCAPGTPPRDYVARVELALKPPFILSDVIHPSGYALGYAVSAGDESAAILTQQAGHALHKSKADPMRTARQFDRTSQRESKTKIKLTAELRQAIQDDDFFYHYQPQFDLATGRVVGAEALLRWNHPVFGLQMPASFLAIAEETGLILQIEANGLRQVARFACEVNARREKPLNFSVNISPLEVTRADLVGLLARLVEDVGVDPSWMTLELTESLMTDSTDQVVGVLSQVRKLGFGLSIDDFGTGYSSLRSIERFPISEIKIDQSFTRGMASSSVKRIVAETVLSLGRALHIDVVAEGIETEELKSLLQGMNCPIGQGYLFSRPVDRAPFLDLLAISDQA